MNLYMLACRLSGCPHWALRLICVFFGKLISPNNLITFGYILAVIMGKLKP